MPPFFIGQIPAETNRWAQTARLRVARRTRRARWRCRASTAATRPAGRPSERYGAIEQPDSAVFLIRGNTAPMAPATTRMPMIEFPYRLIRVTVALAVVGPNNKGFQATRETYPNRVRWCANWREEDGGRLWSPHRDPGLVARLPIGAAVRPAAVFRSRWRHPPAVFSRCRLAPDRHGESWAGGKPTGNRSTLRCRRTSSASTEASPPHPYRRKSQFCHRMPGQTRRIFDSFVKRTEGLTSRRSPDRTRQKAT